MSLWLAKRILPFLEYLITRRWATGAGGVAAGTLTGAGAAGVVIAPGLL